MLIPAISRLAAGIAFAVFLLVGPASAQCLNDADCDDGLECTTDICNSGTCVNTPMAAGTSCGDPSATDCNQPDTRDGAGNCVQNFVLPGTPCGDPSNTECDNPDVCSGSGTCLPNGEPDGTPCTGGTCQGSTCMAGAPVPSLGDWGLAALGLMTLALGSQVLARGRTA